MKIPICRNSTNKGKKSQNEKMCKLQREFKFLERHVQRVRTKLQKLQHHPILTPSTNTANLQPKQLINQHDYHMMTHSRTQDTHEHDTHTDSYMAGQQIRLDAMLL